MPAALIFGLLGLIVGSFLNVLIVRHGVRSIGGRSACPSCGKTIHWYDNIPVVSWFVLRGRCRFCSANISIQYPLVEVLTAVLFVLVGNAGHMPWNQPLLLLVFVPALAIVSLLLAIAVYDLYHKIIPDLWVYSFDALAFGIGFWNWTLGTDPLYFFFVAGPFAALPLFFLWLVSRGAWMGFGDVKLALGIGWLLGPLYGIVAVFFAFVIGAVISIFILLPLPHIMYAFSHLGITSYAQPATGFTMKSEIPFGPFLICSCFILWFLLLYGIDPLSFVALP